MSAPSVRCAGRPYAEVVLRLAALEDAPAIAAVHVGSWRTTYTGIVAQEYIDALSVDDRTALWERRLRGDGADVATFVAESPGRALLGFGHGGPIREPQLPFDAELYALYLLQAAQGQGLGNRLVMAWAGHALARGLRSGVVGVLAANPACRFYERLGAKRVKERMHTIGSVSYPAVFYGWDDLRDLVT